MGCDYYELDICRVFLCSLSVVLLLTVPGSEAIKQEVDEDGQKQSWDGKKVQHLHTNICVSVSVYLGCALMLSFSFSLEHFKVKALQSSWDPVSVLQIFLLSEDACSKV